MRPIAALKTLRLIAGVLALFLACLSGSVQASAAASALDSEINAAKATRKAAVRPAELVDVNQATVDELKTLPGIGDAYALKIVKNRPYANKSQLSSKGVIPVATYRKIRPLIIAKQ
jgi:DNA uptake protein ComE-like DNA-binding protein